MDTTLTEGAGSGGGGGGGSGADSAVRCPWHSLSTCRLFDGLENGAREEPQAAGLTHRHSSPCSV